MTTTTNLGLKKPDSTDPIDISVLNENSDTLDVFAERTNTALAGKQDSIADLASIRSGAAAGATAVQQTAFETDQARQDSLEADDRAALVALVDGGAKNLINITDPVSVPSGINVTKDGNHIVVSGTVTSDLALIVLASNLQPVTCSLVLSGCPTGGSINSYRLDIRQDSAVVKNAIDYGDGSPEFTVSHGSAFEVAIRLARGTYENLDFTPMLCTAADYAISPAFVPYRPSWQEMYDMIKALQSGA